MSLLGWPGCVFASVPLRVGPGSCHHPHGAQDLLDNVVAIADPSFLQVCDADVAMWGHTTPSSRAANLETRKALWHATEGMAKLWRQIKDTVAFAVAANAPIPPE